MEYLLLLVVYLFVFSMVVLNGTLEFNATTLHTTVVLGVLGVLS